jgi:hypothetical protein
MPSQLSPPEYAVFEMDTHYLEAGIPIFGSRVTVWDGRTILIYNTKDLGYVLTDISDMPASTIAELTKQSEIHGMWFYLPQATQEIIAERAEQVIAAGKAAGNAGAAILDAVSQAIGTTLSNLIQPLIVPLIIIGVILGIYLIKKG